jgi:hypothetical protein
MSWLSFASIRGFSFLEASPTIQGNLLKPIRPIPSTVSRNNQKNRKMTKSIVFILIALLLSFCKEKVTEQTAILKTIDNQLEIKYRIVDSSQKDSFMRQQYLKSADIISNDSLSYQELIPNSETAVKIAYVYLSQVYGEKTIIDEFPLNVDSIGGTWIITGSGNAEKGGTVFIRLKKNTGTVINLYHDK